MSDRHVWCVIIDNKGAYAHDLVAPDDVDLDVLGDTNPLRKTIVIRSPVFRRGELLLLNDYYREVSYPGRKPDKWDIEYELFPFDKLGEALERRAEMES